MCLIVLYIVVNPLEGKSVLSSHPVLKSSRLCSPLTAPLTYFDFVIQQGLICSLRQAAAAQLQSWWQLQSPTSRVQQRAPDTLGDYWG